MLWFARHYGKCETIPLAPNELGALASVIERVELAHDTFLFEAGEAPAAAFIVRSGHVELLDVGRDRWRLVARVTEGGAIGDRAVLLDTPHQWSARVAGPTTLYRFERAQLIALLYHFPRIAMRWIVNAGRLRESAEHRAQSFRWGSLSERIVQALLDESDPYGEVLLSQSGLADVIGITRQSVNSTRHGTVPRFGEASPLLPFARRGRRRTP
jgi:CRP-like cAMP-binding protein